jgi:hypothetical protein
MNAETIARALGGRKAGGGWKARCPAHDDRNPSLSIRDEHGQVLVRCHAGCEQADVIAALRERGLWTENGSYLRPACRSLSNANLTATTQGQLRPRSPSCNPQGRLRQRRWRPISCRR